jgi:hypothetical protein
MRIDMERAEDRKTQQAMMEAIAGRNAPEAPENPPDEQEAPLYVSDNPKPRKKRKK